MPTEETFLIVNVSCAILLDLDRRCAVSASNKRCSVVADSETE